jgi:transcriptional regulator with XRE-family HTH domain
MLPKISQNDTFEANLFPMGIGENFKKIREQQGWLQKQVAAELAIGYSNYNKIERGTREASVEELIRFANLFSLSLDQVVFYDDQKLPTEVNIESRPSFEQMELMSQLEEEDRKVLIHMIDTMLTRKRFKDFFEEQLAAS